MVKIGFISKVDAIGNILYITTKELGLPIELTDVERSWVGSQFEHNKDLVHINRYDKQIYILSVPSKKQAWQTSESLRCSGADVLKMLNTLKQGSVSVVNMTGDSGVLVDVVEGMYLASYQFIKYVSEYDKKLNSVKLINVVDADTDIFNGLINLWDSVGEVKTLVNEPAISLSTVDYVDYLRKMCGNCGITLDVFDKEWLVDNGMGGILSVNMGSVDPPYLCSMEWKPDGHINSKPIVLIGKGIMYDTGGLSLKPSSSMETMKSDMGGSAAVTGVMRAIALNNIPLNVIALIPMTDNIPGPNAYAPGDVIKMHSGIFVEVLNTDAEGRMLLADALSFAKKFDPHIVIDIATLTGSARAAVGENASVIMGTAEQKYINDIIECGLSVHERLVQFPLWYDYGDMIKSDIADINNTGGLLAGAITAGKFLEKFTSYPWMHIDIGGSAYNTKGGDYRGKGATGMGVRLLYSFLNTCVSGLKG
jgi:leucyl aminopeptidase